jgi:hypothetical protein
MKTQKFATVQTQFAAAFVTRIDASANDNMRAFLTKMSANFAHLSDAQIEKSQALEIDLKALSARIAVSDKSDANFIAQYALEKVCKAMRALVSGSVGSLDKYTFSIVKNLAKLQTLDNLNTQRALCSKIEIDELAQAQAIKVYHNCSPSTASTQASSTRMMLEVLNICNVKKCAKGDSISFTETETAKTMQAMFAN